ncbi:MAG: thermonuclease family protein [Cyanobacteriota bacterium]|nr:thermonuclease family protein [Cyanobacteriota bacterium]
MASGLLAASCQSSALPTGKNAIVQRAVSGQTLEVLIPGSTPALIQQVRLLGISAPRLEQKPWGETAKRNLEQLLGERASVLIEEFVPAEKDPYNRIWASVWYRGNLLNESLVQQGYALAQGRSDPKYSQRLARAQEYARILGYGIWNPAQPLRQNPREIQTRSQRVQKITVFYD